MCKESLAPRTGLGAHARNPSRRARQPLHRARNPPNRAREPLERARTRWTWQPPRCVVHGRRWVVHGSQRAVQGRAPAPVGTSIAERERGSLAGQAGQPPSAYSPSRLPKSSRAPVGMLRASAKSGRPPSCFVSHSTRPPGRSTHGSARPSLSASPRAGESPRWPN